MSSNIKDIEKKIESTVNPHGKNLESIEKHHRNSGFVEKNFSGRGRMITKAETNIYLLELEFNEKATKSLRNSELQQFTEYANKQLNEMKNENRLSLAKQSKSCLKEIDSDLIGFMKDYNKMVIGAEEEIENLENKLGADNPYIDIIRDQYSQYLIGIMESYLEFSKVMRDRLKSASMEGINLVTGDAL